MVIVVLVAAAATVVIIQVFVEKIRPSCQYLGNPNTSFMVFRNSSEEGEEREVCYTSVSMEDFTEKVTSPTVWKGLC